MIDKGDGRYWKIEAAGANNTKMVSIIGFGTLATPMDTAKPPNRIEKPEPQLNKEFCVEDL